MGVLSSWKWSPSRDPSNEIKCVVIVVEEPIQVCFLLPTSLITSAMCVNSTEKNLDTTAFLSSWVVAVENEKDIGASSLTVGACFELL